MATIQLLKSNEKLLMKLLEKKKDKERSSKEKLLFIELIQKLAREIVEEMTKEEQSFLIRLFIESKINELKLIIHKCPKKIELMLKIIDVSLLRYNYIFNKLADIVVRLNNSELYTPIWPSDFSWEVKKEKKREYYELLGEVGDDSKTDCAEHRNYFRDLSSDFVFEELYAELDIIRLAFYSIDTRDLNSLNSLLELLLAFESKFLSEKEKFDVFERKFKSFQKETKDVLEQIINSHYQYEMKYCGDSPYCMENTPYTEPLADMRILIETMNAVLSNECQKDCDCHLPKTHWSSSQFTHKPIVLTPELVEQIVQHSAELKELLK